MVQNFEWAQPTIHKRIGNWVLLKIQPCRQSSLAKRATTSSGWRYFRHLPNHQKNRINRQQTRSTTFLKIACISFLVIKTLRCNPTFLGSLPPVTNDSKPTLASMTVLSYRLGNTDSTYKLQVLIQLHDLPPEEAMWEDVDTITHIFPSFHLEDKVILEGGRDFMDAKSKPPSTAPVTN